MSVKLLRIKIRLSVLSVPDACRANSFASWQYFREKKLNYANSEKKPQKSLGHRFVMGSI